MWGKPNRGLDDKRVLRLAEREGRVLVTNDKDFGELIFLQGRRVPGVLLLRLPGRTGAAKAPLVLAAVREADRFADRFVVVEPGRLRSRKLRRS